MTSAHGGPWSEARPSSPGARQSSPGGRLSSPGLVSASQALVPGAIPLFRPPRASGKQARPARARTVRARTVRARPRRATLERRLRGGPLAFLELLLPVAGLRRSIPYEENLKRYYVNIDIYTLCLELKQAKMKVGA